MYGNGRVFPKFWWREHQYSWAGHFHLWVGVPASSSRCGGIISGRETARLEENKYFTSDSGSTSLEHPNGRTDSATTTPPTVAVSGFARLTYHWRLDEAPGVGLGDIRLEHARWAPGLVHSSKHVDLPPAHRGCGRMHRFGQRADGFPLVGYCVIPGEKEHILKTQFWRVQS